MHLKPGINIYLQANNYVHWASEESICMTKESDINPREFVFIIKTLIIFVYRKQLINCQSLIMYKDIIECTVVGYDWVRKMVAASM